STSSPGASGAGGSAQPSAVGTRTYKVKSGDTLVGIAAKFGTTPKAISKLNGITNPSALKVGEILQIPYLASAGAAHPFVAPLRRSRRGQCWQPRQYEVMKPPARTSVILVPQRGQGCPPLSWTARKSRTCFSNVGGTRSCRTAIASANVVRVAAYSASTSSAASDDRFRNGSRC